MKTSILKEEQYNPKMDLDSILHLRGCFFLGFLRMLHVYFKQTMDRFGIKGAELAKTFGCSRNHISEIRTGKCCPPINRLWELLETMEELAPGAKEYFGSLVAGYDSPYVFRFAEMMAHKHRVPLDDLSDQELGQLLVDIGNEMSKRFAGRKSSDKAVVGLSA